MDRHSEWQSNIFHTMHQYLFAISVLCFCKNWCTAVILFGWYYLQYCFFVTQGGNGDGSDGNGGDGNGGSDGGNGDGTGGDGTGGDGGTGTGKCNIFGPKEDGMSRVEWRLSTSGNGLVGIVFVVSLCSSEMDRHSEWGRVTTVYIRQLQLWHSCCCIFIRMGLA